MGESPSLSGGDHFSFTEVLVILDAVSFTGSPGGPEGSEVKAKRSLIHCLL